MNLLTDKKVVLLCCLAGILPYAGCRSDPSMSNVPSRTILGTPVHLQFDPAIDALPSVEVHVNGAPPRLFIVDTGTSGLVLSRRFLGETRPGFLGTSAVMDTLAGVQDMGPMCHVAELKMGSVEFRGVTACTADLSNLESALNHELGGVIGMGVFADCQMTLDYPAGDLLLEPIRETKWTDTAGMGIVLPLKLSETGLPLVPLSIHGTTAWAMIDSGNYRAFSLPYDLVERLGSGDTIVRTPGVNTTFHGSTTSRTVQLRDSIFLGPREFLNPLVHVEAREPRVGHQILRHFIVTIDLKNKQIRFAHAPRA
jgi:hypothetical protein